MSEQVGLTTVEALAEYLTRHDEYIFTTHMTPDGDGLGSELALMRSLRAKGKSVQIINCSSVPEDLRFLVRSGEIITYQKDKHASLVREATAIVAFDLGGAGRLGRMEPAVRSSPARKILVDHHIFENDLFDMPLLDTTASSSAEITWRLLGALGVKIDKDVAEPLYVGLIQDTGSFNYNTTSPLSHRIAAEFLEIGVNPYRIWKKLNCQKSFGRVRLMGLNISRIEISQQGKIASLKVDLDFLKRNQGEVRDAFEVVNHFLTINGVEVGCLALQIGSEKTKFSLRSAGRFDVFGIAKSFGGGGHRYAAGFTVDGMSTDQAFNTIMTRVTKLVNSAGGAMT